MGEFFSQTEQLICQDASHFLSLFCEKTKYGQGLLSEEDLMPLWRKMDERNFYRAEIPRIALIGQFKAGKSTLLNALLGHREYAASDFLEMTSWIARYWPSDDNFCNIIKNNGEIERWTSAAFYEKCQKRAFSERELQTISRVDIGVPTMARQVSWIDCPGLGSVNRANEKRMIEALEEADLLLWVVDCESTGNIADTQLVKYKAQQGMPCWVVVTKADLVGDAEEMDELLDDISYEMGIPKKQIFATSAKQALADLEQSKPIGKGTGIPQLWEALGTLQVHAVDLRDKAERSHRQALFEQIFYLLEKVQKTLLQAEEGLAHYEEWLSDLRESVLFDLQYEAEAYARENLFGNKRPSLFAALEALFAKAQKGDLSHEISQAIRDVLGAGHLEQFWKQISTYVLDQAKHIWQRRVLQGKEDLQRIGAHFDSDAWRKTSFSPEFKDISSRLLQQTSFDAESSVLTSLGIAGAATAYAAWLAPFAAKVTIGAAATGVGLPIAATGIALSVLFHKMLKGPQKTPKQLAVQVIEQYEEQFLEKMLRKHFFLELHTTQDCIVESLKTAFEGQIRERLPKQEKLVFLRERCEYMLGKVQQIIAKTGNEFGSREAPHVSKSSKHLEAHTAQDTLDQFATSFSSPSSAEQHSPAIDSFHTGGKIPPPKKEMRGGYQYDSFLDGRFMIKNLLGEGGMGLVFLCEDKLTKQELALKSIRFEISQQKDFQESFWREVAISRSLSHPNIIRCYDLHQDKQQKCYFFTMEYVEGEDLDKFLKKATKAKTPIPFEWKDAIQMLVEVGVALEYAHASGIVHRDLKPSNVMRKPSGQLKIGDFGISKVTVHGMTRHTGQIGTAAYVAPEQFDGGVVVTPAADIFSLGVLAYQLITGKLPLGIVSPPCRTCPELPSDLDKLIMQAMANEPEERPALQDLLQSFKSSLQEK